MTRTLKLPYPLQIGLAVLMGCLIGLIQGPKASVFGEIGVLLIQLLKMLATPLIFFAIIDAFCRTSIRVGHGARLLAISLLNALIAGTIALTLGSLVQVNNSSHWLQLSVQIHHQSQHQETPELILLLKKIIGLFTTNHTMTVIVGSVLTGIVLKRLQKSHSNSTWFRILEIGVEEGLHVTSKALRWIIRGVPLAVFGIITQIVGIHGFGVFSGLGYFVVLVISGIMIHVGIYYPILLATLGRTSPLQFFSDAKEALLTAFGTGSSLATLPVTLDTLQSKMKISPESSRLAACVGTNLNHDGILLYEAVAALFIAQVHGISLGLSQKALVLGISALAAFGIAGVPDAGLITLSLVLGTVGLPVTFVPILMTVDWLIGRFRATTNVVSDMVVATVLDRFLLDAETRTTKQGLNYPPNIVNF